MTFSEWGQNLRNFFIVFLNGPFLLQLAMASLDAILCVGHLHLKKEILLKKSVSFVLMFSMMFFLCMFFNSLMSLFPAILVPYLVIFSIIVPGVVYILMVGKSSVQNKIIKALLHVSSAYVVTEVCHQVNMISTLASLSPFFRYLPNFLMPLVGFFVGFYNINRYPNIGKPNLIMSIGVFLSLFFITLLSSCISTDVIFIRVVILLVLIAFLCIELGHYVGVYFNSRNQETILEYQAQAKLNDAAYLTLKLNEESIARTSAARHDLKNHYAYLKSLLQQKKYDEAMDYISSVNEDHFGNFHIVDCGNYVISSIINLELSKARLKHIELKYLLAVPSTLPFKETDLCSLLTNLIDNALESMEREQVSGFVDVKLFVKEGYFRISLTNPTKMVTMDLHSRKTVKGHGYGLKIIQNIVKQNNGFLHMEIKDGSFNTDIMLDMDAKGEMNHVDYCDD